MFSKFAFGHRNLEKCVLLSEDCGNRMTFNCFKTYVLNSQATETGKLSPSCAVLWSPILREVGNVSREPVLH